MVKNKWAKNRVLECMFASAQFLRLEAREKATRKRLRGLQSSFDDVANREKGQESWRVGLVHFKF